VTLFARQNVKAQTCIANPAEIKQDLSILRIQKMALASKMIRKDCQQEIAITKLSGDAKWVLTITPLMKALNLGLIRLSSFLICLGRSHKAVA